MLQANLFNTGVFCVRVFVNASAFVERSEDNVWESVLSVHQVSLETELGSPVLATSTLPAEAGFL